MALDSGKALQAGGVTLEVCRATRQHDGDLADLASLADRDVLLAGGGAHIGHDGHPTATRDRRFLEVKRALPLGRGDRRRDYLRTRLRLDSIGRTGPACGAAAAGCERHRGRQYDEEGAQTHGSTLPVCVDSN